MSTLTNEAQITLFFADETEKTFTLPSIPAAGLNYVKPRCAAINAKSAEHYEDFAVTFISNAGASFVSISAAKTIETTEEVLYGG